MNEVEIALSLLSNKLKEQPEVILFFGLKKQIEKNEDLQKLSIELKATQKDMTKAVNNDAKYFRLKKNYELLLQEYDNHPLVVNFRTNYEQLVSLLEQLQKIIE
jgi:cell fate (sporulation/competence/biofilm development) regulator YlbF (YheA/YmcA/DUF963 family)